MPNIFITGAGRRIGKHLALDFAKKGWCVAIHYFHSQEEAEDTKYEIFSSGGKAITIIADARKPREIAASVNYAFEKFGQIDVLVNNAGIFPDRKSLIDLEEEMWDETMDINLKAAYLFSRYYAKNVKETGRIINIASLGAYEIFKERIPYNVSKAGLVQLTKALARDLAPKISVNCVAPGVIDFGDDASSEKITFSADRIPMKRFGNSDDMFDAVKFFAEASQYITGQTILVDGGFQLV